jgi:uncharacterized protein
LTADPVRVITEHNENIIPTDGSLDYIELPAPDIPATKKFYGDVFGRTFVDYRPEDAAFNVAGRNGGFNAARKVVAADGGPLMVLYAADLDAIEAKVRAESAEIVDRVKFEGSRRFHFQDPTETKSPSGPRFSPRLR